MKVETCNEGEEGTMGSKDGQKLNIVFLGHKRVPSREGGVEVVVEELATRMAAQGHNVTVLNRSGHHIAGAEFDAEDLKEYNGFRIKKVPTINRKGLAAATSSFFGCIQVAFGKYDIVHIHAEGPAFFCWIPKVMKKKVIVTVHGACEIMGSTGEKPVKSRLHGDSVFYPNSNTEYHIKNICSGILKRFCYIQMLLRQSGRAFFCWAFSKPLLYDPGIA